MSDDVTHQGDVNNDVTVGQANYSAKVFKKNYQKQKMVKYTKSHFRFDDYPDYNLSFGLSKEQTNSKNDEH